MAELIITEITRKDLNSGKIPANYVLCEQMYESEGMKTKSGIVVGFNTDATFQAADDMNDKSSHVADMSENAMIVYKCPQKLWFDPEDTNSMPWDTNMELQEGDIVWSNPIDVLNAVTLKCEDKFYKLIPYWELYVAKRFIEAIRVDDCKMTIPLNGYALLSKVKKPKLSELDITDCDDPTKGIIRYIGNPNKRYRQPEYADFVDLKVGDTILYDKKAFPFALERTSWNNMFSDTGEIFMVCQRRNIAMVIERK